MSTNVRAVGRQEAPLRPTVARGDDRFVASPSETTPGLIRSVWRFRWLAVAITLAVTGLSALIGSVVAPPPTATVSIALTSPQPDNVLAPSVVGDATLSRYTAQRADYITSDDVLKAVSAALTTPIEAVRGRLSVSPSATASVISIAATGPNRAEAAALANAVVVSYGEATKTEVNRRTEKVSASIETDVRKISASSRGLPPSSPQAQAAAQSMAALESKASTFRTDNIAYGDGVDWATHASEGDVAVAGLPYKTTAIGFIVGLALSMVAAWLLSERRREVATSGEVAQLLESPLLGVIRRAWDGPNDDAAEGRQRLALATASVGLRARTDRGTVVVVGVDRKVASRDIAMGIASGLTVQGNRTLFVEGDVAYGEPGTDLPLEDDTSGFATMLADTRGVTTPQTHLLKADHGASVEVMPLGRTATGDAYPPVGGLPIALATLQGSRDFVIIDGGSLDSGPVTSALIAASDALVFVVPDHADEEQVLQARATADTLHANLVGYIYQTTR